MAQRFSSLAEPIRASAWWTLGVLWFSIYIYCSIDFSTQQIAIISALKQREPLGFPSTALLGKSEASWDPISTRWLRVPLTRLSFCLFIPHLTHGILGVDLLVTWQSYCNFLPRWRTDISFCVSALFGCAMRALVECKPRSPFVITWIHHSHVLKRFPSVWTICSEISSMASQIQMIW